MDADENDTPIYRDPDARIEDRVEDLLDRMTLAEKIGQVVGTLGDGLDDFHDDIVEGSLSAASPFAHGGGANNTPRAAAELANAIQEVAVEETRLGVPMLFYVDADHGHARISGATAFPHNLGMAATRDVDLVEQAAETTATEVAATGAHQNLNPVADVARESRWGRVYETFGESPSLCAALSAAKVRGYQGDSLAADDSVAATVKHFPAYGDPARGEDASPVDVSPYTLRRIFLPPFERAVDAGVESVMPCYNDVDGEPVHGSRRYLTELLRGELGFDGHVVSDWGGVHMLHEDHRTAASMDEAVWQGTTAGLDLASVGGTDYADRLESLVEDGHVDEQTVTESARRVLETKFRLGLFEDPYVDPDVAVARLGNEAHRDVALQAARESVTLLQNENDFLPFDADVDEVLVAGPNADDIAGQFGGWSSVSDPTPPAITVRDGVETVTSEETSVTYEQGATTTEGRDVEAAASAATNADVAVVVVGEGKYVHEFGEQFGESGADEFPNRQQLDLPDAQRKLIRAIHATGTPTAVVVNSGRPLTITPTAELASAILWTCYPGTEGGRAIAEILFGETNPSGALPVSFPRSTGHLPTRFNYRPHPRPVGHESEDGTHLDSYDPLFEFGHGLSYTSFEYADLEGSESIVGPAGTLDIAVTVKNVGERAGAEPVDVFVTDEYSSRVTPVRELLDFGRVELDAGEAKRISFTVDVADDLSDPTRDGKRRVESGEFTVRIADLETTFEVSRQFGRDGKRY